MWHRDIAVVLSVIAATTPALADGPGSRVRYAVGLSQGFAPDFPGASTSSSKVRPIIAFRYRRLRLSSSGGSSILSFGQGDAGGASAELLDIDRFKVRAALRVTSGRDSAESPALIGLPDIDRTLIGRVSAFYSVTPNFGIGGRIAWDMIDRGNGATATARLQYQIPVTERTFWSMGAAVTWGNATHLRAWYGVPPASQTPARPAYSPGSGLKNFDMYMGFITRLSSSWVAFGRLQVSRALDVALDSPITTSKIGGSMRFGIGYRCCAGRP